MPTDSRFLAASELAERSLEAVLVAESTIKNGEALDPEDPDRRRIIKLTPEERQAGARQALAFPAGLATSEYAAVLRNMEVELAGTSPGFRCCDPDGNVHEHASAHEAVVERVWSFLWAMLMVPEDNPLWPVIPENLTEVLGVNLSMLRRGILNERAKVMQRHAWLPVAKKVGGKPKQPTSPPGQPRKLLKGWHAITAALGMKYGDRNDIRRMNKGFSGPIKNSGSGTKPMVCQDELLAWWDILATQQQELANQRRGAKLSAEATHNYGREGTAAPEIGGGVKKRRRDRKT